MMLKRIFLIGILFLFLLLSNEAIAVQNTIETTKEVKSKLESISTTTLLQTSLNADSPKEFDVRIIIGIVVAIIVCLLVLGALVYRYRGKFSKSSTFIDPTKLKSVIQFIESDSTVKNLGKTSLTVVHIYFTVEIIPSKYKKNTNVECSIDGRSFGICTSPIRVQTLEAGKHNVKVRVVDTKKNVIGDPQQIEWTLERGVSKSLFELSKEQSLTAKQRARIQYLLKHKNEESRSLWSKLYTRAKEVPHYSSTSALPPTAVLDYTTSHNLVPKHVTVLSPKTLLDASQYSFKQDPEKYNQYDQSPLPVLPLPDFIDKLNQDDKNEKLKAERKEYDRDFSLKEIAEMAPPKLRKVLKYKKGSRNYSQKQIEEMTPDEIRDILKEIQFSIKYEPKPVNPDCPPGMKCVKEKTEWPIKKKGESINYNTQEERKSNENENEVYQNKENNYNNKDIINVSENNGNGNGDGVSHVEEDNTQIVEREE